MMFSAVTPVGIPSASSSMPSRKVSRAVSPSSTPSSHRDCSRIIRHSLPSCDGEIDETLVERTADPYIGQVESFAALPRVEQELRDAVQRTADNEDVYHTYTCDRRG